MKPSMKHIIKKSSCCIATVGIGNHSTGVFGIGVLILRKQIGYTDTQQGISTHILNDDKNDVFYYYDSRRASN
jgi:hypothetical protein